MSFRIFAARARKQDMMLLSGWLFADLLLGLMAIFMISIPPRVTLPPVLKVNPIALSPADTQHCQGGINKPTCTVTVSEAANSEGNVNWTPSSDMGAGVQFSPPTGTLSPGQSVTITIANIPCQNGFFTINGSRDAMPAVVTWQCPVKLEDNSVRLLNVNIKNVQDLLSNSSQANDDIKLQLRSQPLLKNRSVGLAIVYGGSGPEDNRGRAVEIAAAIYRVMQSMQNETTFTAFQRASYYEPLILLGQDPTIVTIDVYRYQQ